MGATETSELRYGDKAIQWEEPTNAASKTWCGQDKAVVETGSEALCTCGTGYQGPNTGASARADAADLRKLL
jgi:hypothetical protein